MPPRGKTEVLEEKPVPVPLIKTLRLTQIILEDSARKHGQTWLYKLSVNAVQVSNYLLFSDPHKTCNCTVRAEHTIILIFSRMVHTVHTGLLRVKILSSFRFYVESRLAMNLPVFIPKQIRIILFTS
jgi:hypothetical protein